MPNLVAIQFLALGGYAILRITVGLVWLYLARIHYRDRLSIAPTLHLPLFPWPRLAITLIIATELVVGILFLIGAWTQLAALIAVLWCLKLLIFSRAFSHPSFPQPLTTVLLLASAVNLFITGAGVLAFDLPI